MWRQVPHGADVVFPYVSSVCETRSIIHSFPDKNVLTHALAYEPHTSPYDPVADLSDPSLEVVAGTTPAGRKTLTSIASGVSSLPDRRQQRQ